jgi:hypothetical protein
MAFDSLSKSSGDARLNQIMYMQRAGHSAAHHAEAYPTNQTRGGSRSRVTDGHSLRNPTKS